MTKLFTLALLGTILPATAVAQRGNVRAAIDQANARYVAAFNKGDVAEFAKVYAPDAILMPPNGSTVNGQAAIADFWQGAWNSGVRNVRLTTTELLVNGNEATEVGTAQLDLQSPQGAVVGGDRGKYIVVWKRSPKGDWQWYRDIWNSDAPMAPPAAASAATPASVPTGDLMAIARAMPGDPVWVVLNPVKPDRRADFEEFLRVFWGAGLAASNPATRNVFAKTRVLFPTQADADGNYTYIYIMDPVVAGGNYSEEDLSRQLLPAAEAQRIIGLMKNAMARGQESFAVTAATRAALGLR